MKSVIEVETFITLKLNKEEALWLRSIVQNPIGTNQDNEIPEERIMRKRFFDALTTMQGMEV